MRMDNLIGFHFDKYWNRVDNEKRKKFYYEEQIRIENRKLKNTK